MICDIHKISSRFSRSNEFDTLKLILACSVVYIHAQFLMETPSILNFGKIPAVPIFIFLSGLFVSESFYYSPSTYIYIKKRLRRILPAYFSIVVLGGFTFYLINLFSINYYETNLFSLLKYFFHSFIFFDTKYPCVHNIPEGMANEICAVNGSLWIIKYELFFYSLIPGIFFLAKFIKYFFPFLSILALLILSMYDYFYVPYPQLVIFLCFLSGVGISMSRRYWINIFKKKKITSFTRFLIVLLITLLSGGYIPLFITLPLLTIFCLFPTKNADKDFNAIKYGDLSYGIYLIHWPLIQIFNPIFNSIGITKVIYPLLIIIFSSLGAIFLYWKIERNFLYKDNHYYLKKNN